VNLTMAPPSADIDLELPAANLPTGKLSATKSSSASRLDGALSYSGTLDSYEQFDVTNVIGREFPTLQLSEILHDDAKIRDLAILGTSCGFPTSPCQETTVLVLYCQVV
jgi:hypothetical protein